jgi:hypothetical protein
MLDRELVNYLWANEFGLWKEEAQRVQLHCEEQYGSLKYEHN